MVIFHSIRGNRYGTLQFHELPRSEAAKANLQENIKRSYLQFVQPPPLPLATRRRGAFLSQQTLTEHRVRDWCRFMPLPCNQTTGRLPFRQTTLSGSPGRDAIKGGDHASCHHECMTSRVAANKHALDIDVSARTRILWSSKRAHPERWRDRPCEAAATASSGANA